jgi:HlyD family secretion protein
VNVIADFVKPADKRPPLGDAFRVEAKIVVWESDNALNVPAGSLFRQRSSWAVYLVEGPFVELRAVRIGRNNGVEAEVLEGLKEGDRVVVHPSDKLRNGSYIVPRITAE